MAWQTAADDYDGVSYDDFNGGPGSGVHGSYSAPFTYPPGEQRARYDAGSYVVTFDPRPVTGPGSVDQLRRMSLDDARALVLEAARIPKRGRIIDVDTLDEVQS